MFTTCQWRSPSVLSKKRSALLVFFRFIYFLNLCERMNVFFLQHVFKRLYNNSGREMGTIQYFCEELQRRNVTQDVKHYEDCEQLFLSIGRCFSVEALISFFGMVHQDSQSIIKNRLHIRSGKQQADLFSFCARQIYRSVPSTTHPISCWTWQWWRFCPKLLNVHSEAFLPSPWL